MFVCLFFKFRAVQNRVRLQDAFPPAPFQEKLGSRGRASLCLPPSRAPPRLRRAQRPPRTHRYTTGMGASMNLRLTSHGERTRADRQARCAPGGPVRRWSRCGRRQPPFSGGPTPSGVRGFGEAGFRATKRKEEKTNRKSPGSKHRRGNAGRAPGVGETWGAAEQSGGDPGGRDSGPQRREKP